MTSVKLLAIVIVPAALLIGGIFLLSGLASTSAQSPRLAELQGSGVLDGMAFESHLGPVGQPADVSDTLSFSNALFLSAECERRCNYPARPYFTREKNGRIEFISETRCPDKDATLVWRGSVDNGTIACCGQRPNHDVARARCLRCWRSSS